MVEEVGVKLANEDFPCLAGVRLPPGAIIAAKYREAERLEMA